MVDGVEVACGSKVFDGPVVGVEGADRGGYPSLTKELLVWLHDP